MDPYELRLQIGREINTLMHLIEEKKQQIKKIDKYICDQCDHEWEDDYIDCLEEMRKITFCKKCCLTKKESPPAT
tara:strand:+ start:607 stop:831 length:225 start_codon:yes stop_codon:yes gene_type:complete